MKDPGDRAKQLPLGTEYGLQPADELSVLSPPLHHCCTQAPARIES